jgi:hypothetical protein
LLARVPSDFTPGWRVAEMLRLLLEPEDPETMPAALCAGWKVTSY